VKALSRRYQVILILFLAFVFFRGIFAYTWHSEFWSILLAKQFFVMDPENLSVYVSPLFHFILNLFYYIPLPYPVENIGHLLIVKSFFSLIGISIIYLFWKNLGATKNALLLTLVVFSNPFVMNEIGRVRADWLIVFFTLLLWQQKNMIALILAFLSTPKALFFSPLIIYSQGKTWLNNKKFNFFLLMTVLVVFVSLTRFEFYQIALAGAWGYLKNSYGNFNLINSSNLFHFFLSTILQIIFFIYILRFNKVKLASKDLLKIIILLLLFIFSVLSFSQKNTYFIASLWIVFIFLIFNLVKITNERKIAGVALVLLLNIQIQLSIYDILKNNSRGQFYLINRLEEIFQDYPNLTFFDATGVLPRKNNLIGFFGPNEPIYNEHTTRRVLERNPEVILRTYKVHFHFKDYENYLKSNFTEISPEVYLKSFQSPKFSQYTTDVLFKEVEQLYGLKNISIIAVRDHRWKTDSLGRQAIVCDGIKVNFLKASEVCNKLYIPENTHFSIALNDQALWLHSLFIEFSVKYWLY
jgi:hypothetical protein